MRIENNQNITNKKNHIEKFIQSIIKELKIMEKTLVVDRIENNIAICEDRKSGEILEINILDLPEQIKEGTVLKYENGKYKIDLKEQKNIEQRIQEKMKNIWNDN